MKSAFAATAFAIASLSLAACRSNKPDVIIQERRSEPSTVVIEKDHVHGTSCGHYYYNGHWYAEPAHIHIVD
jgi:hypothetical protein